MIVGLAECGFLQVVHCNHASILQNYGDMGPRRLWDHYLHFLRGHVDNEGSVDNEYRQPARKMTAPDQWEFVSEARVFHLLDHLRPTAAGLDNIPAWFLRLGAPVFAAPIANLFNRSIVSGVVPQQRKAAVITPIPKVSQLLQPGDFRPISLTPIMSRVLEGKCTI